MGNAQKAEETRTEVKLNPHWKINSDKGHAFVHNLIQQEIYPTENRRRARTAKQEQQLISIIGMIVANVIAMQNTQFKSVFYSRKTSNYTHPKLDYYLPKWLGITAFKSIIETLVAADLILSDKGSKDYYDKNRKQSTLTPTKKLLNAISNYGLTNRDIIHDTASEPVLHLKDKKKNLLTVCIKEHSIKEKDADMRIINKHLSKYPITISDAYKTNAPDQLLHDNTKLAQSNFLYKVFNNGSFGLGGRLYGGQWQLIKSRIRPHLLIDGNKTVEWDYQGCQPRWVYHNMGLELTDDPYNMPKVEELLLSLDICETKVRKAIKYQTTCMLSSPRKYKAKAVNELLPEKGDEKAIEINKENFIRIREAIVQHHKPIEEHFYSGVSLKYQFVESEICTAILLAAVKANIPVLSIHDSFVTTTRNSDWLKEKMTTAYQDKLGFKPIIH